jgi:hypothetical protein
VDLLVRPGLDAGRGEQGEPAVRSIDLEDGQLFGANQIGDDLLH